MTPTTAFPLPDPALAELLTSRLAVVEERLRDAVAEAPAAGGAAFRQGFGARPAGWRRLQVAQLRVAFPAERRFVLGQQQPAGDILMKLEQKRVGLVAGDMLFEGDR